MLSLKVAQDGSYIARGSSEFVKAAIAIIAAGFSTMAAMNCVQPMMPVFSNEMGVGPATASLSLSLCIQTLALSMPILGVVSDAVGRKNVMTASLFLSALLMISATLTSSWSQLLAFRVAQGVAFSGVPAVAIAYLSEEVDSRHRGFAVGLYVSGGLFGGMGGRVIAGVLVDYFGWRGSLLTLGMIGLLVAGIFRWLLPASRHFRPQTQSWRQIFVNYRTEFADPRQCVLFLVGFALMGCSVATYNYLGYRLGAPEFSLSQTSIGLVFLVYIVGMASSPIAGGLADKLGKKAILSTSIAVTLVGLLVMAFDSLTAILLGLSLFTCGVFAAHTVAGGWVAANTSVAKSRAASLYLLFYYTGGAMIGWVSGYFWQYGQWPAVTIAQAILLLAAMALILLKTSSRDCENSALIGERDAANRRPFDLIVSRVQRTAIRVREWSTK